MLADKPKIKQSRRLFGGGGGGNTERETERQQFSNAPVQTLMTSGIILMFHMLIKQK